MDGVGHLLDVTVAAHRRRIILTLLHSWRGIGDVCAEVTEHKPGVWVHANAKIDPGTRFLPPVWIGSNVTLRDGDIVVGPDLLEDEIPTNPLTTLGPWPARDLEPDPAWHLHTIRPPRRVGKRLFDLTFSAIALIVSAPLVPLIMIAIWLEDGRPFIFSHTRQTIGGRNFTCYKFRTMGRNADQMRDRFADQNVCDGPQFHIENDPRLLRVGRFLRHLHLDELPQFVNVLLGQMSVIGPRPSPDSENQYCPAWRDARLSVKPGLTGLWQVRRTRARNSDFQEWIRYDLEYVHHQNWRLDLWILYRTAASLLTRLVQRRSRHDVTIAPDLVSAQPPARGLKLLSPPPDPATTSSSWTGPTEPHTDLVSAETRERRAA